MIFNFMLFISLKTNINLSKYAALYLLSYLLNTCASCEWYTMIYSKKMACQEWNLVKIFHICVMLFYDIGDSLLNYCIGSDFGNFCFNWSFNVFVKLPIIRQNGIGYFQYLRLRNLTTGYRIILVGKVGLQIRTFSSPRYLTMFVMIYTSICFVP